MDTAVEAAGAVATVSAQSVTNGWDAICALNAEKANSIFFQQYLQDGPTNPATPLRMTIKGEGPDNFWLLDLVAGPPQVTFPTDLSLQQVQVTMFLIRGALIEFDSSNKVITSAILVAPNESWITGPVSLGQVTGQGNTLGQAFLDLGTGAYTPQIKGVDPDSVTATDIGEALQTFFKDNATTYPLGTLMETGVAKCLQPTSFKLVTQPAPGNTDGDGCVLLLICTDGSEGAIGQLDPYPLQSGQTAALVVLNEVIFNKLLPMALSNEFKTAGATFAGSESGGVWQTSADQGSINVGKISGESDETSYWTQDAKYGDETPVVLALNPTPPSSGAFTVSARGAGLAVSWPLTWTQGWGWYFSGSKGVTDWDSISMSLSCQFTASAHVAGTTDVVSFTATPSPTVSFDTDSYQVWGDSDNAAAAGSMISDGVQAALNAIFQSFALPDVDAFALANLLFPNGHAINLQNASVPCDLVLTGQMEQPLTISPSTIELGPGQQQQFTASEADVLWEIKPAVGCGSISSSGLYTAPSSVTRAEVVVVTAIRKSDESVVGGAMILVYEPLPENALVVSPANLILTAGQSFDLLATDDKGNAVDVTWALSPNLGQMNESMGVWTYTAPSPVSQSTPVTLTATSKIDQSQTGAGTVTLTPTEAIVISPASVSIKPGQTHTLTATSKDLDEYGWQVYPIGAGTVTPDESDSSKATYTAPASVTQSTVVTVVAYSLGDSAGIGFAQIDVSS